ncbi:MAG: AmmeMemoRadiSam system protein B [Methylococcales bacterium]
MNPSAVRTPAVSGTFYPKDPVELRHLIDCYLASAKRVSAAPKAIIAPHAGYIYSGPVAASAYSSVANLKNPVERIVLIGPSHRVGFEGIALSSAAFYSTPLGDIPIELDAHHAVRDLPGVRVIDQAHAYEHSLEVHLPFLQQVLGAFKLIPLVAGSAPAEQVAEVLDRLWGGTETLIVISSDLSHYHDYATARKLDTQTSRAIESLEWRKLDYASACGRVPVCGLLYSVEKRGLQVKTLDLRNSGDTAGSRDRVVGYGAYLIH